MQRDEPGAIAGLRQAQPDALAGRRFYEPSDQGFEKQRGRDRRSRRLDEQGPG